jgi:hypothetical protein
MDGLIQNHKDGKTGETPSLPETTAKYFGFLERSSERLEMAVV